MKYVILVLVFYFQQAGTITKNNGEQVRLNEIEFYQDQDNSSGNTLSYTYRGTDKTIEINKIKRINLKESKGKKKGITTWLALIVTRSNQKYEVDIDLVEVRGKNAEGKQEGYSTNSIDKITL